MCHFWLSDSQDAWRVGILGSICWPISVRFLSRTGFTQVSVTVNSINLIREARVGAIDKCIPASTSLNISNANNRRGRIEELNRKKMKKNKKTKNKRLPHKENMIRSSQISRHLMRTCPTVSISWPAVRRPVRWRTPTSYRAALCKWLVGKSAPFCKTNHQSLL